MTENHSNDIAESETSVGKNISVSELAARRLGGNNQVPETTEEQAPDVNTPAVQPKQILENEAPTSEASLPAATIRLPRLRALSTASASRGVAMTASGSIT